MPYWRHVAATVEAMELEAKLVARRGWRHVDVQGALAREIVERLATAARPVGLGEIMRELDLERSIMLRYLRALERAQRVSVVLLRTRAHGTRRLYTSAA